MSPPPELWFNATEALLVLLWFVEYLLPEITGINRHTAPREADARPALLTAVVFLSLVGRVCTRWGGMASWSLMARWVAILAGSLLLIIWLADLIKRWRTGTPEA